MRIGYFARTRESDGASYYSGTVARERDRLRQQLLEARGWRFHRIWSTDWFNDPGAWLEQVVSAYRAALAAGDAAVPVPRAVAPAPSSWTMAAPVWRVPRPRFQPGRPIAEYSVSTLTELVRHIRSDDVLCTREEELAVVTRELGFERRGARIVAAIEAAQARA